MSVKFDFRKKEYKQSTSCKIYVNGKPLNYTWNNFQSPEKAFRYLMDNSLVGVSILSDYVTIVESISPIVYDVDVYSVSEH